MIVRLLENDSCYNNHVSCRGKFHVAPYAPVCCYSLERVAIVSHIKPNYYFHFELDIRMKANCTEHAVEMGFVADKGYVLCPNGSDEKWNCENRNCR